MTIYEMKIHVLLAQISQRKKTNVMTISKKLMSDLPPYPKHIEPETKHKFTS